MIYQPATLARSRAIPGDPGRQGPMTRQGEDEAAHRMPEDVVLAAALIDPALAFEPPHDLGA
jgi:hypothetical protein